MDLLHTLLGPDIRTGLLIILNLIVIESLLSVDNAAVLATMVLDLPAKDRGRALKYGIIGAYVLRGVCLLFASLMIRVWWLKPLGGLYLIYIAIDYFSKKSQKKQEKPINKNENALYKSMVGLLGNFGATVALIELMDLAFSIDNVFAVVAFTNRMFLICVGVFIGILAMRFVAQAFVRLIERFAFLETIAFVVIALLGIKLTASLYVHFYPEAGISKIIEGDKADTLTSIFTVAVFVLPVLSSLLFNFPRRKKVKSEIGREAEKTMR